ncbi:RNA polymerase sigma factor [Aquimarina rhabdastrellae]
MESKFKHKNLLLNELKSGNEKAFTFLMEKYHHQLCTYANSLTKNPDESKDIVQTVFIKLWNKRMDIEYILSIKSYLYKSVYNEFLNSIRGARELSSLEKEHIKAIDNIIVEEKDNSLEKKINIINQEIQNLPPKCKKVFILSKQEGLTHNEISEYLSISIKTVENHITKAFKILRDNIKDNYNSILFLLFNRFINQKRS